MTFTVDVLLSCILQCAARPGYDQSCLRVQQVDSYHSCHICPVTFSFGDAVALLRESYRLVYKNSNASCSYLIELYMFLELDVYMQVYFSFDLSSTTTHKSVDCVACCICHCSVGVRSQNNLFPASLLFAGTFSASLDGFSSGFLVCSCIKAYRLLTLRIFLPQGLQMRCEQVSLRSKGIPTLVHFPRYWLIQHHGNLFCWKS